MSSNIANGRAAAKVMNRSDLTRRLVARLKKEEAVVGGIGNTHFDLWAAGPGRRTSTCSAAWAWPSPSPWASRWHSRSAA